MPTACTASLRRRGRLQQAANLADDQLADRVPVRDSSGTLACRVAVGGKQREASLVPPRSSAMTAGDFTPLDLTTEGTKFTEKNERWGDAE